MIPGIVPAKGAIGLISRQPLQVGKHTQLGSGGGKGSGLGRFGRRYSRLVDQVRFDLAMTWLQDPDLNLTDIAFELGYKEPVTFTRAVQRWTGIAPSDYRRQHIKK